MCTIQYRFLHCEISLTLYSPPTTPADQPTTRPIKGIESILNSNEFYTIYYKFFVVAFTLIYGMKIHRFTTHTYIHTVRVYICISIYALAHTSTSAFSLILVINPNFFTFSLFTNSTHINQTC